MKPIVLTLVCLAALLLSTPESALAQEDISCDSIYMVQPGDSLSRIARRAYGQTSAYQVIFDYNPGIMSDPNVLPAYVGLYIPCNEAPTVAQQTQQEGTELVALPELPATTASRLRILTGSEYPPYVDEGLPNGGFSVELIERSLLAEGGELNFRVDVINDWSSHLKILLADGAYDLAFPWFKPDCSKSENLGKSSVWRCDNLRFSEALHDVVVSFHATNVTVASIQSEQDLQGLRICRPRGYFTHDLEALGLTESNYERVAPRQPSDCFEKLLDGSVDVVTVNSDTADKMLTQLGVRDSVSEIVNLASVQSLHAVAMKTDPDARVNLLRLNKGLIALRNNGDFRKIASTHLRN